MENDDVDADLARNGEKARWTQRAHGRTGAVAAHPALGAQFEFTLFAIAQNLRWLIVWRKPLRVQKSQRAVLIALSRWQRDGRGRQSPGAAPASLFANGLCDGTGWRQQARMMGPVGRR